MHKWIFGYGSLIWRPDFPHGEALPARVAGYRRRFWQGSTDHRGVPGKPGRVVLLQPDAAGHCVGMVYRLEADSRAEVLTYLDHREKGGYARASIEAVLGDGSRVVALTYFATPDNPNYLGPAPVDRIAEQVRHARGPSGANIDYVLRLADSLRTLEMAVPEDEEVFALESLLTRSATA